MCFLITQWVGKFDGREDSTPANRMLFPPREDNLPLLAVPEKRLDCRDEGVLRHYYCPIQLQSLNGSVCQNNNDWVHGVEVLQSMLKDSI